MNQLKKVVSVVSEDVPIDRIRKNVGGYLFIETNNQCQTIDNTLSFLTQKTCTLGEFEVISLNQDDPIVETVREKISKDPSSQSHSLLSKGIDFFVKRGKEVRVPFTWNTFTGEVAFAKQNEYLLTGLMIKTSSLSEASNQKLIEFQSLWGSVCENTQCNFGYFAQYPEQLSAPYRDALLSDVEAYDIDDVMDRGFWLSYFSGIEPQDGANITVITDHSWMVAEPSNPISGDPL